MPKRPRTPAPAIVNGASSVAGDGAVGAQAARELTERIKQAIVHLWELLLEAHEGRVWEALGYSSWAQYVDAEFDFGRQHSYRLLGHGRAIRALREAVAGIAVRCSPMDASLTRPEPCTQGRELHEARSVVMKRRRQTS